MTKKDPELAPDFLPEKRQRELFEKSSLCTPSKTLLKR
jgi:hypothetical protein